MMLKIFNTLTRKKELFSPQSKKNVTLYTCGPTVYDYAHIGNLRTYIFEDVLKRTLVSNGYAVTHVMNITDVGHLSDDSDSGEDKIEKGAKREGKSAYDVAAFYTDAFIKDCEALNIILPKEEQMPRATAYIKEQIELITLLEKKGHTYQTDDGIYFDSTTITSYGKMAQLDMSGLQEGARVEKNDQKKHPTDFALWKFSPKKGKRAMEWDSPWGVGFPGWHIECSAMIHALLGTTIDIHCGGIDHIPIHHTNEIAQSESAHNAPLAKYWMHSEFLLVDAGRMGKSQGNFITLETLQSKKFHPMVYRLFALTAHYRSKLHFSYEALDAEKQRYEKILTTCFLWEKETEKNAHSDDVDQNFYTTFQNALNDDLATPKALAIVQELLESNLLAQQKKATIYKIDEILGLNIEKNVQKIIAFAAINEKNIHDLVMEREDARAHQEYEKSDALRKKIESHGFEIQDRKNESPLLIPLNIFNIL